MEWDFCDFDGYGWLQMEVCLELGEAHVVQQEWWELNGEGKIKNMM